MSHPLHHSISSSKKWGGTVDDYLPIHNWFDATRVYFRDMRHRSMRHHLEGFAWCEKEFGVQITNSDGELVSVRSIAEQHCVEDVGFVPNIRDFLDHMDIKRWIEKGIKPRYSQTEGKEEDFPDDACTHCMKEWGGNVNDYLAIHKWFDEPRILFPNIRHIALRYHLEGVFWCEQQFGDYIVNSDNRMVPVRAIAEKHCQKKVGSIPTMRDYLECIKIVDWMFNPGESRKVMNEIRTNRFDYIN